jgi:5'-nucleotidase (lipoprotein e(P4) family)
MNCFNTTVVFDAVDYCIGHLVRFVARAMWYVCLLVLPPFMGLVSTSAQESLRQVKQESPPYRGLDANLYMQTSAEYRAICYQTFQLAELRLRQCLEHPVDDARTRAVVMDLDETVLDNSGFQSWMLRTGAAYDQIWFDRWERWGGKEVRLVPGAKEFIQAAEALGVRVVHVSNRNERFREQTKLVMSDLGIPIDNDADLKLSTTTSNKTSRRREIEEAEQCRIVLLIGDNLRDFDERFRTPSLDATSTATQLDQAITYRKNEVDQTRTQWGSRWIVLPNPAYGEWTKPLSRGLQDLQRMTSAPRSLGIAFWNVENLFDLADDPLVQGDEEFTPEGPNRWTQERLDIKLDNLARVILRMHGGAGPSVLGLAEVENLAVLEMLRKRLNSLGRDYKIAHHDSPSGRGIDCALFYDANELRLEQQRFHVVDAGLTREIVEATLSSGSHQVTFFVNHWPSRSHDEADRIIAAKTLRARVDQLLQNDPHADLVMMGDFNDHPDDPSLSNALGATGDIDAVGAGKLFNSSWWMHEDGLTGTYVYDDRWEVLDQIIFSPGLLMPGGISWGLGSTSTAILAEDQMYHSAGNGIPRPSRSYSGTTFHSNGYSDHLPVLSTLYAAESP